jgi:hypothetical protein
VRIDTAGSRSISWRPLRLGMVPAFGAATLASPVSALDIPSPSFVVPIRSSLLLVNIKYYNNDQINCY